MSDILLKVDISASYGNRNVLNKVNFDLNRGEALGFVGTSGSGKSTLVLALLGLLPWRGGTITGEVLLDGQNLLKMPERELRRLRGTRLALVPQSPMTALNTEVSIRIHFEQAWKAHKTSGRKALDLRLNTLFSEVQLPTDRSFLARRPSEISVGQAQRVLIALALLHNPAILIADEPTSALDPVTQMEILKLLHHLNKKSGTTLLYVSHDLVSVLQLCDRLAVLDSGTIAECLPVSQIAEVAQHEVTRSLLQTLVVPFEVLRSYGSLEFTKNLSITR